MLSTMVYDSRIQENIKLLHFLNIKQKQKAIFCKASSFVLQPAIHLTEMVLWCELQILRILMRENL